MARLSDPGPGNVKSSVLVFSCRRAIGMELGQEFLKIGAPEDKLAEMEEASTAKALARLDRFKSLNLPLQNFSVTIQAPFMFTKTKGASKRPHEKVPRAAPAAGQDAQISLLEDSSGIDIG